MILKCLKVGCITTILSLILIPTTSIAKTVETQYRNTNFILKNKIIDTTLPYMLVSGDANGGNGGNGAPGGSGDNSPGGDGAPGGDGGNNTGNDNGNGSGNGNGTGNGDGSDSGNGSDDGGWT
jgi:hypothetical protein